MRSLKILIAVGCCLLGSLASFAQEAAPASPVADMLPTPPGTHRVVLKMARGTIAFDQGVYRLIGKVTLESDDTTITADAAEYTRDDGTILADGNVAIETADHVTYHGDKLCYSVKTRAWKFTDYAVDYLPGYLGKRLTGTVYLKGGAFSGLAGKLEGRNTRITTCDEPTPHYCLVGEQVEIIPGDKLIARNVDVYIGNRKIMRLPWFIVWLKNQRTPFVPDSGSNSVEGKYVRLLYQYALSQNQLGGVRLDMTEKLGEALGLEHFYTLPGGFGSALLYGWLTSRDYKATFDHTQNLPKQYQLHVLTDLRRDSIYAYTPTTSTNLNFQLQQKLPNTSTMLTFVRRLSDSTYSSDAMTANLNYSTRDALNQISFNSNYNQYGSSGFSGAQSTSQDLWNHLLWTRSLPGLGKLNFRVDDHQALETVENSTFSGVQHLPEVMLESDQDQLHWSLLKKVPSQFTVGWGLYDEQPQKTRLERYLFKWRPTTKPRKIGRTTWTSSSNLQQTIYGDKDTTAMYTADADVSARTQLGKWTNVLRYAKTISHGYSPFLFDSLYSSEIATEGIQYTNQKTGNSFYLNTGRDMENRRWQDLTANAVLKLRPGLSTTQALGYDFNYGIWRDLVSQVKIDNGKTLNLGLNTRYDMQRGAMRYVSASSAWVLNPKWKVQWIGAYNAPSQQLLYNEFLVTRDLHCWEVSAYYSYQRKYFFLSFRLKALDLPLPQFGIGRGGELLTNVPSWPRDR